MNISLDLYKVFHTVAKYENISQAAEELYISQPAVSRSIKSLEAELEIILFVRNSKGVKLTSEGRILFDYIDRAMYEISAGEKIINKLKAKEQGIIKLGVSNTLCKYFLIPNLKGFMDKHPDIQIQIINKTNYETLKLLDSGKIDFGIVSNPFEPNEYNFIKLMDIQDIFVAKNESFEQKTTIKEVISKYPLMLLEQDNLTRQYIEKYFNESSVDCKPEIEIGSMDFLIEFAKLGMGIASVIREFITEDLEKGLLVEVPIDPLPPRRDIGIVCHKKIPLSIAAKTLISYLQDIV